jgi:hypothetical protein
VKTDLSSLGAVVWDELLYVLVARVQLLSVHLRQLLQRVRHHRPRPSSDPSPSCRSRWGEEASGRGVVNTQRPHGEGNSGEGGAVGGGWGVGCGVQAFNTSAVWGGVGGEGQRLHFQQTQHVATQKLHLPSHKHTQCKTRQLQIYMHTHTQCNAHSLTSPKLTQSEEQTIQEYQGDWHFLVCNFEHTLANLAVNGFPNYSVWRW